MARGNGDWEAALIGGAAEFGIELSAGELAAYRAHLDLLLEHNERAALTSITGPAEIAIKHYLDSLTCLLVRDIGPGERVADVGSGAGFPGIVLAIARPHAHYLLVEAKQKRAVFLGLATEALGLDNVTVLPGRAEDLGRDASYRETCDLVLSRAVAPLPALLEYCVPLARVGGHVLALKGPDARRELGQSGPALDRLGASVAETRGFSLPQGAGDRVLILVEKTRPTPSGYPRRAGRPTKRPLG
jgi:16S rRNA (guanine527-N7)-methyltransferase